jgi:integrase
MSVTLRPYRKSGRQGWEVDIAIRLPNGSRHRERCKAPVASKTAAQRWAEERERHLLLNGLPKPEEPPKEVPTLEQFAPRFMDGYALANRQKPSGIVAKESIIRVHLIPLLGSRKLDAITNEHIQLVKRKLVDRAPKTVNNVMTVLNMMLKKAVEWSVVNQLPCAVRLLPIPKGSAGFYDFDEYERLVDAAKALDANSYLIVLLGGEAGLRCGEMIALEWRDIDLRGGQLCIQRSDWRGHVTAPKSGRARYVPMTSRLAAALRDHRHLRGPRVVCQRDGSPLTHNMVADAVRRSARRAQLTTSGVHRLRHSFCSRLAMCGAPTRAIQELAGHQDLVTTQRYMHLSPAAIDGAIRLLESPRMHPRRGEIVEKRGGESAN